MLVVEVWRAVKDKQTSSPRTVLGFYATVIGILVSACVAAAGVLAKTGTATDLIPWVLGFGGLVLLLVLVGVFIVTLIDPSKLMLGHVTGSEYAEIHRVALGDSGAGEKLEIVAVLTKALLTQAGEGTADPSRDESSE